MAGRFDVTTVIDRPIEEVFAFSPTGRTIPSSARGCSRSRRRRDGPAASAPSMQARSRTPASRPNREFEITEFESPTRIRWTEVSKNLVTASEGGYDLAPEGAARHA